MADAEYWGTEQTRDKRREWDLNDPEASRCVPLPCVCLYSGSVCVCVPVAPRMCSVAFPLCLAFFVSDPRRVTHVTCRREQPLRTPEGGAAPNLGPSSLQVFDGEVRCLIV